MENTKRIVVADTGTEFRKNLIRALSDETDFQVVGETGDGAELMRFVQRDRPDAVVMDMVLTGGMDGMDVLDAISRLPERPRVLILSGYIKGSVVDAAAAKGRTSLLPSPAGLRWWPSGCAR